MKIILELGLTVKLQVQVVLILNTNSVEIFIVVLEFLSKVQEVVTLVRLQTNQFNMMEVVGK